MRSFLFVSAVAALGAGVLFMDGAPAGEYSPVPHNLAQIQDPLFRDAMTQYSPRYDSLPRNEQIAAFVNMFKVLNHGQTPPLAPHEAEAAQAVRKPASPGGGARNYDPWADPGYNPDRDARGILSGVWSF